MRYGSDKLPKAFSIRRGRAWLSPAQRAERCSRTIRRDHAPRDALTGPRTASAGFPQLPQAFDRIRGGLDPALLYRRFSGPVSSGAPSSPVSARSCGYPGAQPRLRHSRQRRCSYCSLIVRTISAACALRHLVGLIWLTSGAALRRPRALDPRSPGRCSLPRRRRHQLIVRQRRHLHVEIDAVEQRKSANGTRPDRSTPAPPARMSLAPDGIGESAVAAGHEQGAARPQGPLDPDGVERPGTRQGRSSRGKDEVRHIPDHRADAGRKPALRDRRPEPLDARDMAVQGDDGPGGQRSEVACLSPTPQPRSSTAGAAGRSRQSPRAFAAQARLPGP